MGKRSNIVVMAEGTRCINGEAITSEQVKEAMDAAGLDSRITILGHVQRGGSPSSFDRNMVTRLVI